MTWACDWDDVKRLESTDKNVFKYVFTKENAVAEAVLYRYPTFKDRTVICCSTMSGCPVGCRFCGSGDYFNRLLTWREIADQVRYVLHDHAIDANYVDKCQFMYMSMGEPLLNWRNLRDAIWSLNQTYPKAQNLISTMGPEIPQDTWDSFVGYCVMDRTVGLQFSVHESTDEARNKLIPFKAKLPLTGISMYGYDWYRITGRKPFFNYCTHAGNTSQEDVARLVKLFRPDVWECTVSVVCEREEHVSAANERQRSLASDFSQKMLKAGYNVRVFNPAGQDDIGGGCGQLWYVQEWMREHPELARPSVGKGLPVLHTEK